MLRRALSAWYGEDAAKSFDIEPLGRGHINSTWRVSTGSKAVVLQQISQRVFSDPEAVVSNHLLLLEAAARDEEFNYRLPQLLPTLTSNRLLVLESDPSDAAIARRDQARSYWRLCPLIDDSRALETLGNTAQAQAAGQAFGEFQRMAQAIPAATIRPVIDHFLELDFYWRKLEESWNSIGVQSLSSQENGSQEIGSQSSHSREAAKALWLELVERSNRYLTHRATASLADGLTEDSKTNVKAGLGGNAVIHGDCKVNNLLFDERTDAVIGILDLDTLMFGPWWLDFGDLVRSAAFETGGAFRADFYASVAAGFFAGRGGVTADELRDALQAPAHLSFMLCVRFLDDHFRGDRYFRVERRGDNLQRAQAQFAQLVQLENDACRQQMRNSLEPLIGKRL